MLQHAATCCNTGGRAAGVAAYCRRIQSRRGAGLGTLEHTATHCNMLQHSATHCNMLQHSATRWDVQLVLQRAVNAFRIVVAQVYAPHCTMLQHTTRCDTLQHTATHCNALQHNATHCNTMQHTAAHCNILQLTATHCNRTRHLPAQCAWLALPTPCVQLFPGVCFTLLQCIAM